MFLERREEGNVTCVALDEITGEWSGVGCERQPDQGPYVVCKCSHTTNFGALLNGGGAGGSSGGIDTESVASQALDNFLDNNDGGVIQGLDTDISVYDARDILGSSNVDDQGNIIIDSDLDLDDLKEVLDSQADLLQYIYDYVDDARKAASSTSARTPWTIIIIGYSLSVGVIVAAVIVVLVVTNVKFVHDRFYGKNQRTKHQRRRQRERSIV